MSYGVTSTGFARKPLTVILAEIQEASVAVFGPGVIQTPESPLGQLNGLYASLATTLWELAEGTYQSYDPDQAEGVRLEQLGRIRLLERMPDELDPSYRAAITNAGNARIDLADIARAALNVDGVNYAHVFLNAGSTTDANGLSPHSVAVAVLGGDDAAIAAAIRPFIVPGVDTSGNRRVDVTIEGYCRSIFLTRPVEVPLSLQITVAVSADRNGCPPPSNSAIALAAYNALSGDARPLNGDDITLHRLRTAISSQFPNVEVLSATSGLVSGGPLSALPRALGFFEIATFALNQITVATSP